MIINLRGTSGSGKTYAVKEFLYKNAPYYHIMGAGSKKPVAHLVFMDMMPVYAIGSYENVCGGCDTVPTQDMICGLVRHFSQFGHVLFEGLLMSHLWARYKALCEELTGCGEKYVWLFLDTPIEICLDRVDLRRALRGVDKPLNPHNTISKHQSTWKVADKAKQAGFDVRWLKYDAKPEFVLADILRQDDGVGTWETNFRKESFR